MAPECSREEIERENSRLRAKVRFHELGWSDDMQRVRAENKRLREFIVWKGLWSEYAKDNLEE